MIATIAASPATWQSYSKLLPRALLSTTAPALACKRDCTTHSAEFSAWGPGAVSPSGCI